MLRVRNSFLEFHTVATGAVQRCKSVSAIPSTAPSAAHFVQSLVVEHLNEVLVRGLRPSPWEAADARATPEHATPPSPCTAAAPGNAKGMKPVFSNNSMSTMVPDDSDELVEVPIRNQDAHRSEGREKHEHHQGSLWKSFHHVHVPKSLDLAEEFRRSALEGPPTTMMIRNIPNRYTQRDLTRELEKLGFAGTFDFFYAPVDTGTMGNVGYAFVNFRDPAWATRCVEALTGYAFKKHQRKGGEKLAIVSVAHLQGLEANIRHYEKAAVSGRTRSKRGPWIMTGVATSLSPDTQE